MHLGNEAEAGVGNREPGALRVFGQGLRHMADLSTEVTELPQ
jgi:hypothetical protein